MKTVSASRLTAQTGTARLKWLAPCLLFRLALGLSAPALFAQGPLTPPGAPAPTMKTLDQVEARTPISTTPFTITQPGSYYLTTNLEFTAFSGDGILIDANNVTLDLNGFAIIGGNVGSNKNGVRVAAAHWNISVRNGAVYQMPSYGVDCALASNSHFERLRIAGSGSAGIRVGSGSVVGECSALWNLGSGMVLADGCSVRSSSTLSNSVNGMVAGNDCTIKDCTALGNGSAGIQTGENTTINGCSACLNQVRGMSTGNGCVFIGCTVSRNGVGGIFSGLDCAVNGCTVTLNTNAGLLIGADSSVTACSVTDNTGDGILVSQSCQVINNVCENNGGSLNSGNAGIHASGDRNRIENNHVTYNKDDGIKVDDNAFARKNVVVRNSSSGNGGFQFRVPGVAGQGSAGDNAVGPIVSDPTSTNANAWANFSP